MPTRIHDCQPCCSFCPRGMTCNDTYCINSQIDNQSILVVEQTFRLMLGVAVSYSSLKDHIVLQPHRKSVAVPACFKLASCDPNMANQNIHAYGVMFIVGLSTLLLVIYNCSDQVLSIRERRLAKSRVKAAKNARAIASVRERSSAAVNYANKNVIELKSHTSRFYSYNKSLKQHDEAKISGHDYTFEHLHFSVEEAMQAQVRDPKYCEEFWVELEDNNKKKKLTAGKESQTRSQIFEFASAQSEKEKVIQHQNENQKASIIISLTTGDWKLFGMIEKRQISGGLRKRVNVGLEMFIEPSLLILDKPTSGLDSSTSQLLLRALRHEASEGGWISDLRVLLYSLTPKLMLASSIKLFHHACDYNSIVLINDELNQKQDLAIMSVFGQEPNQQDSAFKLEKLHRRMIKVRELFRETESTEFVIAAISTSELSGYNGTIMAYGQTYTVGNLGKEDASELRIMVRTLEDISLGNFDLVLRPR
ncbi:hypothetical protein QQ045_017426 [Rhodiola kirilowii]